jgi:hypothetical protein
MKITFDPYLNDELTKRVKRALKSGRKMRIDVDGRSVDFKIGEPIGPDPAIEQPLTRAQLGKAVVRRGRRKQTMTLRLDPDLLNISVNQVRAGRRGSTRHCAARSSDRRDEAQEEELNRYSALVGKSPGTALMVIDAVAEIRARVRAAHQAEGEEEL